MDYMTWAKWEGLKRALVLWAGSGLQLFWGTAILS